jgi:sterol desaturase/sphingolipid hydroxylase (fatty acid hydroxylase superfamily)
MAYNLFIADRSQRRGIYALEAVEKGHVLRLIVVTPDMHRVHHSVVRAETDSNFGFNLPWWDWLFGTYRREPQAGHDGMVIGIPQFRDPHEQRLDRMLTQPFRNES